METGDFNPVFFIIDRVDPDFEIDCREIAWDLIGKCFGLSIMAQVRLIHS